jgi:hypothetical protein
MNMPGNGHAVVVVGDVGDVVGVVAVQYSIGRQRGRDMGRRASRRLVSDYATPPSASSSTPLFLPIHTSHVIISVQKTTLNAIYVAQWT